MEIPATVDGPSTPTHYPGRARRRSLHEQDARVLPHIHMLYYGYVFLTSREIGS